MRNNLSDFHISSEIKVTVSLYHCIMKAGEVLGLSLALKTEIYRKNRKKGNAVPGEMEQAEGTELGPVSRTIHHSIPDFVTV